MEATKKQFAKSIRHHDVCSFVQRLCHGLREGEDPEALRKEAVAFWRGYLEDYLSMEQDVLLPVDKPIRPTGERSTMLSIELRDSPKKV
jgi:hypothetical protein